MSPLVPEDAPRSREDTRFRLAIFATHPIQYQTVLFRELTAGGEAEPRVFFGGIPDSRQQGEGFGLAFRWDLPLLEGYDWRLLGRKDADISLYRFFGLRGSGFLSALREFRPQAALILGWNSFYLLQGLFACRLLGIPALVRGDSNDLGQRSAPKRLLQRLLFAGFQGFLYVGQANRALYRRAGIADGRLFFVPHFVDNERFVRQAAELAPRREALRREFAIPGDHFCFLFVGKFEPKKRLLDLLAAMRLLHKRGLSRFHLLVVGAGEQGQEAERVVGENGLPVTFAGFMNQLEIVRAYVAADCLVLPSDAGETWGLVVNEAMACGLPAIVSNLAGCGEDLILDGVTGYRFPCGEIDALASVMERISAAPGPAAVMGERAAERVRNRCGVNTAVQGLLAAVREVARPVGGTP